MLGAADFGYQVRELLRDREEALVLVVVRVPSNAPEVEMDIEEEEDTEEEVTS